MVSLLFFHLFITYACFVSGILFYGLLSGNTSNTKLFQKPISSFLFTGVIGYTLVAQWLVLIVPVSAIGSLLLLLSFHLPILLKWRQYKPLVQQALYQIKSLHAVTKAGFICTWVLLLLLNAGPTLMDDTESYHIQAVKWIQEYGTVPGIANLHERYGFNSSWFSAVALFSLPVQHNYYTVLNGVVSAWLGLYMWMQADQIFKSENMASGKRAALLSALVLCVLLLLWPLLRGNASTVNYDFITTALILILFIETFSKPHDALECLRVEYFLWPVFMFTVRIINFPLLALSLFIFLALIKQKQHKTTLVYSGLAILLIVPFLARSVYLSGYPFFPSPAFAFFAADWKVDSKVVDNLLYFIKFFNRVNTMNQPLEQTAALPFPQWIKPWYHFLFSYDKPLVVAGMAGFASLVVVWKTRLRHAIAQVFAGALLMQIAVWFFIAPDPRFIYGPLLCGIVILLHVVLPRWNAVILTKLTIAIMCVLMLFTTALFVSKLWRDERYQNLFLCRLLPQPVLRKVKLDGIVLYLPEKVLGNWNPRCYAAPLPCLYEIDTRLHLRGKTIKEGFSIQ